MRTLVHLVRKEILLLTRDWHALALLFVMPAFFILVMSLAMRDVFEAGRDGAFTFFLVNHDTTATAGRVADGLKKHRAFRNIGSGSEAERTLAIREGRVSFAVVIPEGFVRASSDTQPMRIVVLAGPAVAAPTTQLFFAAVREAVASVYLQARITQAITLMGGAVTVESGDRFMRVDAVDRLVDEQTLYRDAVSSRRPTSVQQNVPAYLIFAMFFVALPLSTTWMQERSQGTFTKLRSIGLSSTALLVGKLVPYLLVNLVQVVLMLAVGVWIVPALGGDALTLGHSIAGLAVMSVAVGVAAVSYALLIANLVRTTEQATILTGATNLLLGALGGVMVPRSIMPAALQHLSLASPMSWGLEGFLDVFLRDGDVRTIAPWALLLIGFGMLSLALAGLRLRRARMP